MNSSARQRVVYKEDIGQDREAGKDSKKQKRGIRDSPSGPGVTDDGLGGLGLFARFLDGGVTG